MTEVRGSLTGSGSAACFVHGAILTRVEPSLPGYSRYECPVEGCTTVWEMWASPTGEGSLDTGILITERGVE